MSHQKSMFILINKTQGSEGISVSISVVYVWAYIATWAKEHSVMCPSPHDKKAHLEQLPQQTAHSCCALFQCYWQLLLKLLLAFGHGVPYFKLSSPKLFQRLQWLVYAAKCFECTCFFKKSTLGFSDHPNCPLALRNLPDFSVVTWDRLQGH